jgi:cytochrome P450
VDPEVPGWFTTPTYYDDLAVLRADAPVREYRPRCFTVARHADVTAISRNPATFRSGHGVLMNDPLRTGGSIEGSILHMDPPEHAPWRRLVSRRFTPRAVTAWEPRIREVAGRVLDDADARGADLDLVDAVAAPFPVLVIAELLGIATADEADFRRWSDATIESPDRPGEQLDDVMQLVQFLAGHVRARRAEPRDDLVSLLATAEIDGRPVTTGEAVGYVLALLVAGNETTRQLVSGGLLALDEHRDQRTRLLDDPTLAANAVEECLRWVTPIQTFGRTVATPTRVGDIDLAADDWVVLLYASANRDAEVFGPTASRFDVGRSFPAPHVAFGFGEHLCLGAALARLEARILFEELLARWPDYEIAGAPEWTASTLVRGMRRLPAHIGG